MDRLEIPLEFAGLGIHRDNAITEKIGTRPVPPIIIRCRSAHWHIEDAALRIHGHLPRPDVGARAAFPSFVEPTLVTHFARTRYRMKIPKLGASSRIVSPRIARLTDRNFQDARTNHHQILEDGGN